MRAGWRYPFANPPGVGAELAAEQIHPSDYELGLDVDEVIADAQQTTEQLRQAAQDELDSFTIGGPQDD